MGLGWVLSIEAEKDLESIYVYTLRNHGPDQLDVYADKIEFAIAEIAETPLKPRSKARDDLLKGCRFYRVEHHYIVYRVKNGRVEIGRILHESMNFDDHLSDEIFQ